MSKYVTAAIENEMLHNVLYWLVLLLLLAVTFILSAILFHAESMERKIIGNSKSADNSPLSSIATDSRVSWRICKIGTINEPVGIMAHWDNHNYSSLHIRH